MRTFFHILRFSILILLGIFLFGCGSNKVVILQNLDQDTANQILVRLGSSNMDAVKQIEKGGTFSILVSQKNSVAALMILQNNGLPNKASTTLGEEFKKDGFISSPLEEQSRFIYALESQIEDMISLIDGVSHVSVQITLPQPEDNILQSEPAKPSASVLIKFKPGYHLEIYSARIKKLVANAVPGLTMERVEVLFISQEDIN